MILLTGNANRSLAEKISKLLHNPLGEALISSFSDCESRIEITTPLRGQDIFIIQSTSPPVNHHLMELCLIIDAAKRAFAKRIIAVIPYFGYARQDKRLVNIQIPIAAKVSADLLTTVGLHQLITVDLHTEQVPGFFSIPIENISAKDLFLVDIAKNHDLHLTIVSPDDGGVLRARTFANQLKNAELAIIHKRRPYPDAVDVMHLIGNVKGSTCIIVDDLVNTANTLCLAAKTLKENGAKKILAYVTHPVLSDNAIARIEASPLDELVVTDSILLPPTVQSCSKLRILSIASLLATVIKQHYAKDQ